MKVSDIVFREDRPCVPGTLRPMRYDDVAEIFTETMDVARAAAMRFREQKRRLRHP